MDSTFASLAGLVVLGIILVAIIRKRRGNTASSTNNCINRGGYQRSRPTQPIRASSLNETEIMDYFANTRHNQKDNWFRFRYKYVNNEWRAYIMRMPSLNGRSPDCHRTHRYSDSNGNYWVCRNPMPTTLKDCQAISKVWADRYLEYVATGVEANSQRWD